MKELFTWANRRESPTYEKLDRILSSVEWEQKFPLVTVRALPRSGSDHTPLILDTGEQAFSGNKSIFSFELAWFKKEGFVDLVRREWTSISKGNNPMEIWQNRIRHLRQFLRGWARNLSGEYKTERDRLSHIIETLDCKAETSPLEENERDILRKARDDLAKLRREEESKWLQRAKVKHIQEGGDNTKYFHLIANGKHRRKKKFQLEQQEGTITGQENLKNYISDYYKSLFGPPPQGSCTMIEDINNDINQISGQENEILIVVFTEEKLKRLFSKWRKTSHPNLTVFRLNFIKYVGMF
jgi:hypothetical protein